MPFKYPVWAVKWVAPNKSKKGEIIIANNNKPIATPPIIQEVKPLFLNDLVQKFNHWGNNISIFNDV